MINVKRRNWTSQARRYSEADAIVVSVGKSGRTWLRVFLYSYFCGLAGREFTLKDSNLAGTGVPKVIFTHDLWAHVCAHKLKHWLLGKYLIPAREGRIKPILVLARDPGDVIVSLFFHMTKRSRRYSGDLSGMIRHPKFGINTIVDVMNTWMEEWSSQSNFKVLRYEDCRKNTEATFRDVLTFLGMRAIDESVLAYSLQFSSFENMKRLEATGQFKAKILSAADVNDSESYKTRRGIVGGFKDYLGPEDILYLDQAITRLDKRFGYGQERSASARDSVSDR